MIGKRKVILVGTGFVGMSMAYALLNQGNASGVNELVLIDVLKDKAEGEAMDLCHGLPCSPSHMKIKSGEYSECKDADIVVITAGLSQKPGQIKTLQANAIHLNPIVKNNEKYNRTSNCKWIQRNFLSSI